MSKRTKPNHNPRNPNICRTCKINTIGKNRMALGHSVCQACSKREETEWWANTAKVAKAKSELSATQPFHNIEAKGGNDEQS